MDVQMGLEEPCTGTEWQNAGVFLQKRAEAGTIGTSFPNLLLIHGSNSCTETLGPRVIQSHIQKQKSQPWHTKGT